MGYEIISISVSPQDLKKIDEAAKSEKRSRSAFLVYHGLKVREGIKE